MLESYWLQIGPYYDSRDIIYHCKMFIRLANDRLPFGQCVSVWPEKNCQMSIKSCKKMISREKW